MVGRSSAMISWLMAHVSLLDLSMAFFVVEVIISTLQVAAIAIFSNLFFVEFSAFLSSIDGVLAGIDFAAWMINLAVAAISFVYDSVKLPCYIHMMIAGFAVDVVYVFRMLFAVFMRSPVASEPQANVAAFKTWSFLYFCLSLVLVSAQIAFLFVLAAVAKEYRKTRRRFFKAKDF